jgi:integrase
LTTWLSILRTTGRSPKTLIDYEHKVGQFARFLGHPLSMATKAEAMSWIDSLQESHKPAGVAAYVRAVKSFFNWLIKEEVIDRSPFKNVTVKVPAEAKRTPSRDDLDAIIDKAKTKRDRCILTLLTDTGMRRDEAGSLLLEDVDMEEAIIYVRKSKTRKRPVPMSARLVAAMGRWLRQRGTVRLGSLWNVTYPYGLIFDVVDRISNHTLSPHDFRRSFAVTWLERGGPEISLQRICGWNSNVMVKHYSAAKADEIAITDFRRLMVG